MWGKPAEMGFASPNAIDSQGLLNYMQKHQPRPRPVGHVLLDNHPPLFDDKGIPYSNKGYRVEKGWHRKSANFILEWHIPHTGPISLDDRLSLDFTKYYQLAKHVKGVGGWLEGGETKLLELYDTLS